MVAGSAGASGEVASTGLAEMAALVVMGAHVEVEHLGEGERVLLVGPDGHSVAVAAGGEALDVEVALRGVPFEGEAARGGVGCEVLVQGEVAESRG